MRNKKYLDLTKGYRPLSVEKMQNNEKLFEETKKRLEKQKKKERLERLRERSKKVKTLPGLRPRTKMKVNPGVVKDYLLS